MVGRTILHARHSRSHPYILGAATCITIQASYNLHACSYNIVCQYGKFMIIQHDLVICMVMWK